MNPAYRYEARLVRVVDGDTVLLNVRLGFYMTAEIRFRLAAINAPRLQDAGLEGEMARDWLHAALQGEAIVVESRKTEKYGRWLGYLYTPGNTKSINQQMVDAGHAKPYPG